MLNDQLAAELDHVLQTGRLSTGVHLPPALVQRVRELGRWPEPGEYPADIEEWLGTTLARVMEAARRASGRQLGDLDAVREYMIGSLGLSYREVGRMTLAAMLARLGAISGAPVDQGPPRSPVGASPMPTHGPGDGPAFVTLPGHILDAIAELRRRFQKGADEYPELTIHYVERPGAEDRGEFIPDWPSNPPPGPLGHWSEVRYGGAPEYGMAYEGVDHPVPLDEAIPLPDLALLGYYKVPAEAPHFTFVFRGDRLDGVIPEGTCTFQLSPKEKPGAAMFMSIAKEAAGLMRQLQPLAPLIPPLAALIDRFPDVIRRQDKSGVITEHRKGQVLLPVGFMGDKAETWVRFVLTLRWAGVGAEVERWTWRRGERNSTSKITLQERPEYREHFAERGREDECPPRRFTCTLPGVFGASVAALTYLANLATRVPPARNSIKTPGKALGSDASKVQPTDRRTLPENAGAATPAHMTGPLSRIGDASTLGRLRRLVVEMERCHKEGGPDAEMWGENLPPELIARIAECQTIIASADGYREFLTYLNVEVGKSLVPDALDEVRRRLARVLRRPFEEVDQLTLVEALEVLNRPASGPMSEDTVPNDNAPRTARTGASKAASTDGFQCSKAELLRAFNKDETSTKYLDQLVEAGRLVLKSAERPIGYARYLARFTDPDEHSRVVKEIEANRKSP
jgi:hypothetical protein